MTPQKLSKTYTDVSNVCWKCEGHEGSFYHMWWTCRVAKQFWIGAHILLQKILLCKVPLLYAQNWKKQMIPEQEELIEKIREVAEMDILSEVLKDCPIQKTTE